MKKRLVLNKRHPEVKSSGTYRKNLCLLFLGLMMTVLTACGGASESLAPNSGGAQGGGEKEGVQESMSESAESAETIKLTYAFFAPAQTFPAVQMEKWAEEVATRTSGKVQVDTFPGGSLLTDKNMYDGVLEGVAHIGLSVTSYEPGRFPLINLAGNLTGLDVTSTVASQMVYNLTQEFPLDQLALDDFKVITAFTSEPAYIQTIDPVRSLEDLQGMELRISGANAPVLEALGAAPVGMSQAETGEALQTGVIDGYASSREVLIDFKYAETVKYMTNYPLTNSVFVAVMNKDKWESLPEDVQQVIDELGPEMAFFAGDYLDKHIEESLTWAQEEQGFEIIELSPEEKVRWDERLDPLNQQQLDEVAALGLPSQEFYDRMLELIETYKQ